MPRVPYVHLRTLALLALLTSAPLLRAQDLRVQATPFSVWLDFQRLDLTSKMSLPIWMESFQSSYTSASGEILEKTNFRIRLRRLGHLNAEVQLRLFFDDQPGFAPSVSGWTETGKELYKSLPLGAGLKLPSSESLTIPVADIDYLDIDVPGNGKTIRGAFLATLQKHEARHALDFAPTTLVDDPFASSPAAAPNKDDSYLFGRVKASLVPEALPLVFPDTPRQSVEFELAAPPLLAVITFEVLNVDPVYPPELFINDRPLGRAALVLPDLADPAFVGSVRALEPDMRFRYTGWIRCQQVVPGSALLQGLNNLVFELNRHSGPIAVRAVQIELKHPSRTLDYELIP